MRDAAQHYRAVAVGKRSRAAGGFWEELLEDSCEYYSLMHKAEITKTPEPMKPIGPKNQKGQFLACYTKQAQPDYKGTIKGGRTVMFEAKFTSTGKMEQSRVLQGQADYLEGHQKLGARCYVIAGFGSGAVYRFPWNIWRDMKKHFGRKYVTEADVGITAYLVPVTRDGVLLLLD